MEVTRYVFKEFDLTWERDTGKVVTLYTDGTRSVSVVAPNTHDDYHGMLLGITPEEHRLHHELAHHIVAMGTPDACPFGGCPIIYADAHGLEQAEDAREREWTVTALQYGARGLDVALKNGVPLLRSRGKNPFLSADFLSWMFNSRDKEVVKLSDIAHYMRRVR